MDMKLKGKVTTLSKVREIRSQIWPLCGCLAGRTGLLVRSLAPKAKGQSESREYKIQMAAQTKEHGSEPGIRDDCPAHICKQ